MQAPIILPDSLKLSKAYFQFCGGGFPLSSLLFLCRYFRKKTGTLVPSPWIWLFLALTSPRQCVHVFLSVASPFKPTENDCWCLSLPLKVIWDHTRWWKFFVFSVSCLLPLVWVTLFFWGCVILSVFYSSFLPFSISLSLLELFKALFLSLNLFLSSHHIFNLFSLCYYNLWLASFVLFFSPPVPHL